MQRGTSVSDWTSSIVPGQDRGLVGEWDARVHVEHVRARLDLGDRVRHHGVEHTGGHLLRELGSPGRVDPLADDHEGSVAADDHLARRRRNYPSRWSRGPPSDEASERRHELPVPRAPNVQRQVEVGGGALGALQQRRVVGLCQVEHALVVPDIIWTSSGCWSSL